MLAWQLTFELPGYFAQIVIFLHPNYFHQNFNEKKQLLAYYTQ
jgi:hypothetical protein